MLVTLGVVMVLLTSGVVALYATGILDLRPPKIVKMIRTWGAVNGTSTQVLTDVTLHNPNAIAIELRRVEYDYYLNGKRLGGGLSYEERSVAAGKDATITLSYWMPSSIVPEWWKIHVAGHEWSGFVIKGSAEFKIGTFEVNLPVKEQGGWQTKILERLGKSLATCPKAKPDPCIEKSVNDWGTTGLDLDSTLTFHNPNNFSMRLSRWSVEWLLGGVTVGRATEAAVLSLAPLDSGTVDLHSEFMPRGLEAWWPGHVQRCERSHMQVRLSADLQFESSIATRETQTFDLGELVTGLICQVKAKAK